MLLYHDEVSQIPSRVAFTGLTSMTFKLSLTVIRAPQEWQINFLNNRVTVLKEHVLINSSCYRTHF